MKTSICLQCVNFRYGPDKPDVLRSVGFEIFRGERIGLIGTTGSGKSTLVDIVMGLMPPSTGRLLVDGYDLYDLEHADLLLGWRAAVAHVPQNIYLADSSIAENIAFGIPKNKIDRARLQKAAEQAQISSLYKVVQKGMRLLLVNEASVLVVSTSTNWNC